MYYKIINDRQAFSQCKTIEMPNGQWISNPSESQIAEAGWLPYTPPPVIPQPQTEPDYEEVVSAIKKMFAHDTEELSDEDALEVAALYPTWASKISQSVAAGERLWFNTKLYKVVQPHTVQEEWTPDVTPALFVEVSIEEIPEWRQPVGSEDAYRIDEKVKHKGHIWLNEIDYNVYEPGVYGWKEIN